MLKRLKKKFIEKPVLIIPDLNKELILEANILFYYKRSLGNKV